MLMGILEILILLLIAYSNNKIMELEPIPIISKNFSKMVIPLIEKAQHSIDVIVYDWRFYKNDPANAVSLFNSSLARASARGVNVRCLVQNISAIDNLKALGCSARLLNSKRILHTKMMLLDRKGIIIGSHNYTQHAFTSNEEASIYVYFNNEENEFVTYFNNLFGL
jgi:phosphatidylserine/phosphatidylglycerophosphate/cardiolipin synthase-like enzyme